MYRMTFTQAQRTRRTVLQAAVTAGARCGDREVYRDLLERARNVPPSTWAAQREAARKLCSGCPIRAACEELALRDGTGSRADDGVIRGGRTGQELAIAREIRQPARLAAAAAADRHERFTFAYTLTTGPITKKGLRREAVERIGAMAMRGYDRGEVWDIAVYDAVGDDVTDDFAFAREDCPSQGIAA